MKNDPQAKSIIILHLENSAQDAELIHTFLVENGFHCFVKVVTNQHEFKSVLKNKNIDAILAEYTLQDLKGDEALQIARMKRPEIPFIFLSSIINEVFAIECLKNGAKDFVLKEHMSKLIPALNNALKEVQEQRKRERKQSVLRENERKFRSIFESSPLGLLTCILCEDGQLNLNDANPAAYRILNCNKSQLMGKSIEEVFCLKKNSAIGLSLNKVALEGATWLNDQFKFKNNGTARVFEINAFQTSDRKITVMFADITKRKKVESDLKKTKNELEENLEKLERHQAAIIEMERLKVVKELAKAVSHEFAQPLQGLSNYITLIELRGSNPHYITQTREMIKRIYELTESLQNIVSLKSKDYHNLEIVDIKNSSEQEAGNYRKILVVDDEFVIRQTLLELFLNSGYECDEAENGIEAIKLIRHNKYDLIISDIMMPEMSGVELFQKIRSMNYSTKFVFLTGYGIRECDQKIVSEADGVFPKPVSFKELLKLVTDLRITRSPEIALTSSQN